MKTPISYYGGKQQLTPTILPLIPFHHCYNEPFFGGGAIFFAKEPSKVECINDINKNVVNFYKVAKRQFKSLQAEIDVTLHSEEQYHQAREIYLSADKVEQENVLRAWALFVLSHQTFLSSLENSWKCSKVRNMATSFNNKKKMFDETYVQRLENTQIFCRDALRVIRNMDSPNTFHFVDPPYYNSDLGHYKGYTLEDFESLLNTLSNVEGKFLLTSYPSEILDKYVAERGWYQIKKEMSKAASMSVGATKTEVITMNYQP
jgi:DNA adenine methylase